MLARVRVYLRKHWRGEPGRRFFETITKLFDYSKEHLRLAEKAKETPDLLWEHAKGEAGLKYSEAILNFAKEEDQRIRNQIQQQTAEEKVLQEQHRTRAAKAQADKAEAQARLAELALFRALEEAGLTVGDAELDVDSGGSIKLTVPIRRTPPGFKWRKDAKEQTSFLTA